MFPPEIQRCIAELQPLQAKLMEAGASSHASVAQIYEWESRTRAIGDEMKSLTRQYGFADAELGEAAGDAAVGASVLIALLRRAPDGNVSRAELLSRFAHVKGLYRAAEEHAAQANMFNQRMTADYSERVMQLEVFEHNLDKFMARDTNPLLQGERPAPKSGCYIATAVYGAYDHPSVMVLRRFRDERLQVTAAGRAFVRSYYAISPQIAHHFSSAHWLNRGARSVLDGIVRHLDR